jgi:hypothetical protein
VDPEVAGLDAHVARAADVRGMAGILRALPGSAAQRDALEPLLVAMIEDGRVTSASSEAIGAAL